jgi:two-component system, OmpR family, sensor histidine kinase TctE
MIDLHRPIRSLTGRVLSAVILLLLLGGMLVSVWTWINGRSAARQTYDRLLLGAANDIAESIRIQDGKAVVDLPVSAFELLAQAPDDRIHYDVRGPDGQLVTGLSDRFEPSESSDRAALLQFFDDRMQGEAARFVRVVRRFAERDFSGNVSVTVGQTLSARQAMTLDLALDALVPLAFAGIALLVIAWFAVRSAVRPLEALASDLARRDPYDLTPMPVEGRPQELRVMLESLNRFMQRLDKQIDGMRNLISDTAHQLRTPVAAIRVQAETMAGDGTPPSRPLGMLLARTRSLGDLLDQLLSRAMVIHRGDSVPRVAFDLREVALDLIERRDHELLSPGAEVRLAIGEDPVIAVADPFSVGQAAKNLLSNALKHGKPPVTIGTELIGAEAVIWVEDTGTGPHDAVIASLGARFERTKTSREDSVGLGLSIVPAVATASGGRVDMSRTDQGFRVALVLPADDTAREDPV